MHRFISIYIRQNCHHDTNQNRKHKHHRLEIAIIKRLFHVNRVLEHFQNIGSGTSLFTNHFAAYIAAHVQAACIYFITDIYRKLTALQIQKTGTHSRTAFGNHTVHREILPCTNQNFIADKQFFQIVFNHQAPTVYVSGLEVQPSHCQHMIAHHSSHLLGKGNPELSQNQKQGAFIAHTDNIGHNKNNQQHCIACKVLFTKEALNALQQKIRTRNQAAADH